MISNALSPKIPESTPQSQPTSDYFKNKITICLCHPEISEHFVSQWWNMKLLYNAHKKTTFDMIMSQMNLVHTVTTYFLMNHSNQLIMVS